LKRVPVIDLSGNPSDIGFAHGKALGDRLKENYSILDLAPSLSTDTLPRLERAKEMVAQQPIWDTAGIKRILSDHQAPPLSICRHQDPDIPQHLRMTTLVSLVFNLNNRSAEVAYGQPCRTEYYQVSL
jgi:isopenicillin-N N-acyltransferase-like protein